MPRARSSGGGGGSADQTAEQGDSIVELALLLEGLGDAIVGLKHLGRPGIEVLQLLKKLARFRNLASLLGHASTAEKRDGLSLLDELRSPGSGVTFSGIG